MAVVSGWGCTSPSLSCNGLIEAHVWLLVAPHTMLVESGMSEDIVASIHHPLKS